MYFKFTWLESSEYDKDWEDGMVARACPARRFRDQSGQNHSQAFFTSEPEKKSTFHILRKIMQIIEVTTPMSISYVFISMQLLTDLRTTVGEHPTFERCCTLSTVSLALKRTLKVELGLFSRHAGLKFWPKHTFEA